MLLRLRIINTFSLALEMQVNMTHWKKIAIKRFQLVCQNRKSLAEGEDKNWHSYFGSKESYAWQSWEQWDIDPNFSTGLLLDSPQAFLVQQVTWTERQWERDPRGNKVGLKYSEVQGVCSSGHGRPSACCHKCSLPTVTFGKVMYSRKRPGFHRWEVVLK